MQRPWPPLEGINTKIEVVKEQINTLRDTVRMFIENEPQGIESDLNPKGNGVWEVVVRLTIDRYPPPLISVYTGAIVYQLRSSLDHLAYALSATDSLSDRERKSIYFPIFTDSKAFNRRTNNRRPAPGSGLYQMRFVQYPAQTDIRRLQPYRARKKADRFIHPLALLDSLSNTEKHRRLYTLVSPMGALAILGNVYGPFDLISAKVTLVGPPVDGAEIVRALIREKPGFQNKVRVEQDLPGEVAVYETFPWPERYLIETLEDILGFIETQVLPPFTR